MENAQKRTRNGSLLWNFEGQLVLTKLEFLPLRCVKNPKGPPIVGNVYTQLPSGSIQGGGAPKRLPARSSRRDNPPGRPSRDRNLGDLDGLGMGHETVRRSGEATCRTPIMIGRMPKVPQQSSTPTAVGSFYTSLIDLLRAAPEGLFAATHGRAISVTMPVFTRTLISFSTIP